MDSSNKNRLFLGSCFALITTALSFAIGTGTAGNLAKDLNFSSEQNGFIGSTWFFGFPISMILGGLLYNSIGPKKIMQFAFLSHIAGIILSIYAVYYVSSSSYFILIIGNLLLGIGCGCTEAGCNPMITDMYEGNEKSSMLNKFHVWFPGGIVIGALISDAMKGIGLDWRTQYFVIFIPAIIYFVLFNNQLFPKTNNEIAGSTSKNIKAMLSPLFIFIFIFMAFTAITEFGPGKWTQIILKESGTKPMMLLALTAGVMAVSRYFAGSIIHKLDQTGVLLGSAILAAIGLYLFSTQTGAVLYIAAIIYAVGVAYFWPNMVGFIAERVPASGALGMSVIGGIGMFSTAIFQPIIGRWIDSAKIVELNKMGNPVPDGLSGGALQDFFEKVSPDLMSKVELSGGQSVLGKLTTFPIILIVAFAVLYFWQGRSKQAA
jgi:MFS transporter, putative metabolite:H+ symporter